MAPLGLLLSLLLLFGLAAGCTAALASGPSETAPTDPLASTKHIDGDNGADSIVLVVDVAGPILADGGGAGPFGGLITGGDVVKDQLEAAASDPDIDAVILRHNTPGG